MDWPASPIVRHPFVVGLDPLSITGFGVAVMFGFAIGQLVGQREIARRGHDPAPIGDVVIAALLGFLVGAKLYYVVHEEGWLFGVYCLLAGIERLLVEFFRAKDDRFFGPFTTAQMIALGFVVVGVVVMLVRRSPGPARRGTASCSASSCS